MRTQAELDALILKRLSGRGMNIVEATYQPIDGTPCTITIGIDDETVEELLNVRDIGVQATIQRADIARPQKGDWFEIVSDGRLKGWQLSVNRIIETTDPSLATVICSVSNGL